MPWVPRVTAFGLMAVLSVAGAAVAQQRLMTLVDLLEVPRISDPQLSPDGRQVVYVRSDADWGENRRVGHIWRVNADGTGQIQMTSGDGERGPRWSPDGETVAFVASRGEEESAEEIVQIYLLPNTGGEARVLTSHATPVSSVAWAPSGAALYFLAPHEKTEAEKKKDQAKDDGYAFDESYHQRHLWRVDVESGDEARVTPGDASILRYELSRDGTRLAYHRAPSPLFGERELGEVWVADADGSHAVRLTSNEVPEYDAALSPDNRHVLFVTSSNEHLDYYYNDNPFVVPAAAGAARMLTREFPYEVVTAAWAADA